jgi:hypothetical protein
MTKVIDSSVDKLTEAALTELSSNRLDHRYAATDDEETNLALKKWKTLRSDMEKAHEAKRLAAIAVNITTKAVHSAKQSLLTAKWLYENGRAENQMSEISTLENMQFEDLDCSDGGDDEDMDDDAEEAFKTQMAQVQRRLQRKIRRLGVQERERDVAEKKAVEILANAELMMEAEFGRVKMELMRLKKDSLIPFLEQTFTSEYLTMSMNYVTYYRGLPYFGATWMKANLSHIWGGVSACNFIILHLLIKKQMFTRVVQLMFNVQKMVVMQCNCQRPYSEVLVDLEKLHMLQQAGKVRTSTQLEKKLSQELKYHGIPDYSRFDKETLEAADETYQRMHKKTRAQMGMKLASSNEDRFVYAKNIGEIFSSRAKYAHDDEQRQQLENIASCCVFYLGFWRSEFCGMPIATATSIGDVVEIMKRNSDGIQEVSKFSTISMFYIFIFTFADFDFSLLVGSVPLHDIL